MVVFINNVNSEEKDLLLIEDNLKICLNNYWCLCWFYRI